MLYLFSDSTQCRIKDYVIIGDVSVQHADYMPTTAVQHADYLFKRAPGGVYSGVCCGMYL